MLERNLLSHIKLALLLFLLSSSFLLQTRLFPSHSDQGGFDYERFGLPLSILLYTAAFLTMIGGIWEFFSGHADFRTERAFLSAPKPHLVLLSVVSAIILSTCVTLLVTDTV